MQIFKEIPFCALYSQALSHAGATEVKRTNFQYRYFKIYIVYCLIPTRWRLGAFILSKLIYFRIITTVST